MTLEQILFYFFSFGMIFFGLVVITNKNPVNSAGALVLVFFFMAGLFTLLEAFFLAAVQILVYAGAIMVLFLFVIMLLNVEEEERRKRNWFAWIASTFILFSLTIGFALILIIKRKNLKDLEPIADFVGTTEKVGTVLFSKYLLPFEVASLILLVAMIGVIILTKKEKA
jgi:NADH-quinone oxidoreductase subunit J